LASARAAAAQPGSAAMQRRERVDWHQPVGFFYTPVEPEWPKISIIMLFKILLFLAQNLLEYRQNVGPLLVVSFSDIPGRGNVPRMA
jgi:hypothetical protein